MSGSAATLAGPELTLDVLNGDLSANYCTLDVYLFSPGDLSDITCDSSLIMGSGPAPSLLAGGGSEPAADFEPNIELVGLLRPGGPAASLALFSVIATLTTAFVGWNSPPVPGDV